MLTFYGIAILSQLNEATYRGASKHKSELRSQEVAGVQEEEPCWKRLIVNAQVESTVDTQRSPTSGKSNDTRTIRTPVGRSSICNFLRSEACQPATAAPSPSCGFVPGAQALG